jgi:hypothetical protein
MPTRRRLGPGAAGALGQEQWYEGIVADETRDQGTVTEQNAARALLLVLGIAAACNAAGRGSHATDSGRPDSVFAATQARGRSVMGVDQYTAAHVFEDLPDGGRIILDRDSASDTTGITTIRQHMRDVTADFAAGDFTKPFQVHAAVVPGTAVMAARRAVIYYQERDRPRGAEVRIRTTDAAAVAAVHEFLAFQRGAHHAGGHERMNPRTPS